MLCQLSLAGEILEVKSGAAQKTKCKFAVEGFHSHDQRGAARAEQIGLELKGAYSPF